MTHALRVLRFFALDSWPWKWNPGLFMAPDIRDFYKFNQPPSGAKKNVPNDLVPFDLLHLKKK